MVGVDVVVLERVRVLIGVALATVVDEFDAVAVDVMVAVDTVDTVDTVDEDAEVVVVVDSDADDDVDVDVMELDVELVVEAVAVDCVVIDDDDVPVEENVLEDRVEDVDVVVVVIMSYVQIPRRPWVFLQEAPVGHCWAWVGLGNLQTSAQCVGASARPPAAGSNMMHLGTAVVATGMSVGHVRRGRHSGAQTAPAIPAMEWRASPARQSVPTLPGLL